jgi:ABC-2 type transport system ATP-binding protein
MSRGTRQKLGLLLALVHRPRLVILDEPTSGLDPLMQKVLARRLRMLADAGHTVLFSSHSLAEVEQLCHRVAIVRDGGLVADESLESLRKRARRRVDLVFDSGAAASIDPPSLLDVVERNGTRWTCNLTGEIHELLSWAAAQPLADIAIRPPDLETLFYRYYGEERSGP